MIDSFKQITSSLKEDIIGFTQKLIQTPSVSGHEGDLANLILAELNKLGYDEAFIDDIGNVVGILKSQESSFNVMYSSHMDNIEPVESGLWKHPPYSATIEDDDIYGVASRDSNAAIASQVYAGVILKKLNLLIKGDYVVSFTVGELLGGCLAPKYLYGKTLKEKNIDINFVVLGNATSLNLYIGQRGRAEFELTLYGRTNSSILPWLGLNAIHKIPPVIKAIEDIGDTLPSHPMFDRSTIAITSISTSPENRSCIPDRAILKIDRRFFPSEPLEETKKQIQGILDKISGEDPTFKATFKLQTTKITTYKGYSEEVEKLMHPFFINENNEKVQSIYFKLKELQESVNFGVWYFNTDGGTIVNNFRIPVLGYSPGEERYFNTPFEKVSIEKLLTATAGNASIYYAMNN